jgi:hypothetical protein
MTVGEQRLCRHAEDDTDRHLPPRSRRDHRCALSVNAPRHRLRNRIIIGRDGAPPSASRSVSKKPAGVSRRVALCTLTRSYWAVGSSVGRPNGWPPFPAPIRPVGRYGMRGEIGQQGWRGPARGSNRRPRANGSPFHPTTPRLVCCKDFKDATKAAAASSTDSSGVAIPNPKNADRA